LSCTFGSQHAGVTCTGYEGGDKWDQIHKICDSIECSICSGHCHEHTQAWRDRIAFHKGKEVYDMPNLKQESIFWSQTANQLEHELI
jgi:hypothetical protein